uniref:Fibrinogen C-terminal domain-containing protein n=1 Tax=Anopheles atroparvus TaxID=41427 RepID=A0A182J6Y9_ANOAO
MLNINETGTYFIRPAGVVEPFLVLCDFQDNFNLGGGWTVFQRRIDGAVNFFQNWTMYKNGFGDVNGEHWLDREDTNKLLILEDCDGGSAYANYDSFRIGNEAEKYKLTVGDYSGTAEDSLKVHNGKGFSTFDQDNDTADNGSCANEYNGAWWFDACYFRYAFHM